MTKNYEAFKKFLRATFQRNQYPYQQEISHRILKALLLDRKRGPAPEIAIEISRQAGKTTAVVDTVTYLMLIFPPLSIGIFSPQREQAKTDFDRLKEQLEVFYQLSGEEKPIESNANTLRLPNGSECYIFPVTSTSHPESKTLDLIICEEAQHIKDHEFMNAVRPMGASTNAPILFVGSAGYGICYFYRLLQRQKALVFPYQEVIKQKRQIYEETRDEDHLNYEVFVNEERNRLGEESEEFRVPYKLEWVLGGGQFATMEDLEKLNNNQSRTYQDKTNDIFIGIDTAKFPDSTVVTVLRWNKEIKRKQIINWLRLRGENYKDQFDVICDFLKHYNVKKMAIDSTGQGDFMPDMFERETAYEIIRVKFSAVTKDAIYKNLLVAVRNLLTEIPRIETKEAEEFREQMLDLQKEYKGELLSCHHPDSPDAHDDYPDSWALAEWAYAESQKTGEANIRFL